MRMRYTLQLLNMCARFTLAAVTERAVVRGSYSRLLYRRTRVPTLSTPSIFPISYASPAL